MREDHTRYQRRYGGCALATSPSCTIVLQCIITCKSNRALGQPRLQPWSKCRTIIRVSQRKDQFASLIYNEHPPLLCSDNLGQPQLASSYPQVREHPKSALKFPIGSTPRGGPSPLGCTPVLRPPVTPVACGNQTAVPSHPCAPSRQNFAGVKLVSKLKPSTNPLFLKKNRKQKNLDGLRRLLPFGRSSEPEFNPEKALD